jgi:ABC-type dipeptide/oligopeptide/nickel transport system permease component
VGAYILRRLLQTLILLILISLLVFIMLRLIPGDPAQVLLGNTASPEEIARTRAQWGLDQPLQVQYILFFRNALRGNLGDSIVWHVPAIDFVGSHLPATFQLAAAAMVIAIVVALPLGMLSAARSHSWLDRSGTGLSIFLQSVPTFWVGLMLILVFAVGLGWLPAFGGGTWRHLVLPSLTLSILFIPLLTRLMRSALIEVLAQDYVRTAHAKGLRQRMVIWRHALPNALIPVITVIGLQFGALLGGAVITEAVFAWPGVGSLSVQALSNRDYPVVQVTVLFLAVAFALINLLVDISYGFLDPRIRYTASGPQ